MIPTLGLINCLVSKSLLTLRVCRHQEWRNGGGEGCRERKVGEGSSFNRDSL